MRNTTSDDDRLLDWVVELSDQAISRPAEPDAYVDAGARVAWDDAGYFSAERVARHRSTDER